jgi:hypothetical protein
MNREIAGRWFNQHGSEIALGISPEGKVTGTFSGRPGVGEEPERFELLGFATEELVAFSVNFGRHGSITSWVGHLVARPEEEELQLLWHMTVRVPGAGRGAERWRGIWSGADVFRRRPVAPGEREPGRLPSHPYAW